MLKTFLVPKPAPNTSVLFTVATEELAKGEHLRIRKGWCYGWLLTEEGEGAAAASEARTIGGEALSDPSSADGRSISVTRPLSTGVGDEAAIKTLPSRFFVLDVDQRELFEYVDDTGATPPLRSFDLQGPFRVTLEENDHVRKYGGGSAEAFAWRLHGVVVPSRHSSGKGAIPEGGKLFATYMTNVRNKWVSALRELRKTSSVAVGAPAPSSVSSPPARSAGVATEVEAQEVGEGANKHAVGSEITSDAGTAPRDAVDEESHKKFERHTFFSPHSVSARESFISQHPRTQRLIRRLMAAVRPESCFYIAEDEWLQVNEAWNGIKLYFSPRDSAALGVCVAEASPARVASVASNASKQHLWDASLAGHVEILALAPTQLERRRERTLLGLLDLGAVPFVTTRDFSSTASIKRRADVMFSLGSPSMLMERVAVSRLSPTDSSSLVCSVSVAGSREGDPEAELGIAVLAVPFGSNEQQSSQTSGTPSKSLVYYLVEWRESCFEANAERARSLAGLREVAEGGAV